MHVVAGSAAVLNPAPFHACFAGYYKLSAKIAMMTRFPDLVELEGENRIVQADAYGEDVRGFTEFLGVTIINETDMVGVQKSKTTISEIKSDRDGQAIEVRATDGSSPWQATNKNSVVLLSRICSERQGFERLHLCHCSYWH